MFRSSSVYVVWIFRRARNTHYLFSTCTFKHKSREVVDENVVKNTNQEVVNMKQEIEELKGWDILGTLEQVLGRDIEE